MNFLSNDGLSRLRLDDSATERDVKKAYARELKLIDPATQPQVFAELRQAYEGALAQVRFASQFSWSAEPAGEAVEDDASPQVREEAGGDTPPHQPAEVVARQPDAAENPAPIPEPAPPQPPGHLPFENFVEALTFPPSDLPAAQAVLRHWLAQDGLMLMVVREAFELELMEALASRRFGQRTAVVFLAASQAFFWDSGRHGLLERMGPVGTYISSLLYEMAVLDGTSQSRWLALTEAPDPQKALTLLKDAERMESLSPALARLFFADGHIEAWQQARDRAPVVLRGVKRAGAILKNSMPPVNLFYMAVLVGILGIFASLISLRSTPAGDSTRASITCDKVYSASMASHWKDLGVAELDAVQDCARRIPPLLCSDRVAMRESLALKNRLEASGYAYYFKSHMLLNLSDGRSFGAMHPLDCTAIKSFTAIAPWLEEGDEKAARQLVSDLASCEGMVEAIGINSAALTTLLKHTDAWPRPATAPGVKRLPLKSLLGRNTPLPAENSAAPLAWPSCAAVMSDDLRPRMGDKEWLAAAARAKLPYMPEMAAVLKTLSAKTSPESAAMAGAAGAAAAAAAAAASAAAATR